MDDVISLDTRPYLLTSTGSATQRVNSNRNDALWVIMSVNINGLIITNALLWFGVLVEAVHLWRQEVYGNFTSPLSFAVHLNYLKNF